MLENNPNPRQSRPQQIYVSFNPDLADILDTEEGTFDVITGNQGFAVTCAAGHSIKSLVPTGTRVAWIIERKNAAETAQYVEGERRSRAANA